MKRNENGEEDLMREAVSLIKRMECRYPSSPTPVVLGLNVQGWLFVYFGSDPMYRFDEKGRLRRAFVDGMIFRTAGNTLAMMRREHDRNQVESASGSESVLMRTDLSQDQLEHFRQRMRLSLENLRVGLHQGEILRQYPIESDGFVLLFDQLLKVVLDSPEFLAPALVRR